jgi:hypothetical protein
MTAYRGRDGAGQPQVPVPLRRLRGTARQASRSMTWTWRRGFPISCGARRLTTLIDIAAAGHLRDPKVLDHQVHRMLADSARSLATNFADSSSTCAARTGEPDTNLSRLHRRPDRRFARSSTISCGTSSATTAASGIDDVGLLVPQRAPGPALRREGRARRRVPQGAHGAAQGADCWARARC